MAYYSEGNCNFKYSIPNEVGCLTAYDKSDVKKVVDNWIEDLFTDEDLGIDEYGYSARILNKDDLFDNLHYESFNKTITNGGEYIKYTENTPQFNLSSCWTMIEVQDYNQYVSVRGADGNFYVQPVYNYTGTVCPVVTVKKQHIDEDNNDKNETSNVVKVPDTMLNNLIIYIVLGIIILIIGLVIVYLKIIKKK